MHTLVLPDGHFGVQTGDKGFLLADHLTGGSLNEATPFH
jgi:hypothetical protein